MGNGRVGPQGFADWLKSFWGFLLILFAMAVVGGTYSVIKVFLLDPKDAQIAALRNQPPEKADVAVMPMQLLEIGTSATCRGDICGLKLVSVSADSTTANLDFFVGANESKHFQNVPVGQPVSYKQYVIGVDGISPSQISVHIFKSPN
jgi:hypothetical protein